MQFTTATLISLLPAFIAAAPSTASVTRDVVYPSVNATGYDSPDCTGAFTNPPDFPITHECTIFPDFLTSFQIGSSGDIDNCFLLLWHGNQCSSTADYLPLSENQETCIQPTSNSVSITCSSS